MRQTLSRAIGALVLAFALGSLTPTVAGAQEDFSEAKLDSFVTAAIAVNDLIQEWQPRIEAAASEQEAAALREQANAELVTAIEDTAGITVEEYQQIGEAAQTNPDLSSRIQDLYAQRLGEQQPPAGG